MSYPQQPGQYPAGQPGQYPAGQPGQYPAGQPGQYPAGQPGQYPAGQPGQYPAGQPGQYPAGGSGQYPGPAPPPSQPPFPGGNEMTNPPSKGTTIATAVLAILGALWAVFGAISGFADLGNSQQNINIPDWLTWAQAIPLLIEVFLLGGGAAALLMRKVVGRWLVTAGCVIHILQGIVGMIAVTNMVDVSGDAQAVAVGGGAFVLVIMLLPAIATLILALLPPTGRWLNWTAPQQQRFQG